MDIKELLPSFGGIDAKIRTALAFGATAFIISLFVGLVSGNFITGALATSLVMAAVFMVLGYAAVFVITRYVPEVLALFTRTGSGTGGESESAAPAGGETATNEPEPTASAEFKPMTDDSFTRMESVPASGDGQLGKHIVKKERKIKYEPKLMAEAIRTMIKKDE
ncbi:MAG TPA: hypothetical protein PKM65_02585 [Spirochaetota bacterium]|nr:hypothetical protein [Spirochaetota bacterium]HNT12029.1 hypothetical protein [Spirochaetota bacterium]HNV49168.1 hypothetical protein [Spirochaetota bacterium]HOS40021.1 hypothetical protein [Spirochaetota bacterium]HPU88775.1 hypothetical protein [Spirochaetota bacterium]